MLNDPAKAEVYVGKIGGNYVDLIANPHKSLTFGGDEMPIFKWS